MTIGKIIEEADALRENAFDREQKLKWLSRVEESLYEKIIRTHQEDEQAAYLPITADSPDTQTLMLPDRYGEVYLYYLLAQMDLHNGEYTRYNNSSALYNSAWLDFAADWNRSHPSLGLSGARAPFA